MPRKKIEEGYGEEVITPLIEDSDCKHQNLEETNDGIKCKNCGEII